jgi:hypothetical protein
MRRLARVATTLALAAAVLSGCGDDDAGNGDEVSSGPTSTPSDTLAETDWGEPATGPVIRGKGYTYRVPKTWGDVTEQAKKMQGSVDTAAAEKGATDGFADNISVGYQAFDGMLEDLRSTMATQLEILVAHLEVLPNVTMDGEESLHHRGPAASAGRKYFLEQFATLRDGRIAIITFSIASSMPAKERDAMIASIMSSWKWAA